MKTEESVNALIKHRSLQVHFKNSLFSKSAYVPEAQYKKKSFDGTKTKINTAYKEKQFLDILKGYLNIIIGRSLNKLTKLKNKIHNLRHLSYSTMPPPTTISVEAI